MSMPRDSRKAMWQLASPDDPYGVAPLPAGRELDERVAREVMGWEVFDLGYYSTDEETPRMRELSNWVDAMQIESVGRYYIDVAKDFWVETGDFAPSTSIADAWTVLEHMRGRGWHVALDDSMGDDGPFWCEFSDEGYEKGGQAWEATWPLAICHAALNTLADANRPAPQTE